VRKRQKLREVQYKHAKRKIAEEGNGGNRPAITHLTGQNTRTPSCCLSYHPCTSSPLSALHSTITVNISTRPMPRGTLGILNP